MRRVSLLTAVALLVAGGGASSRAQVAAPGVRAELVRLDVVVTDASGKLVRDLTREDFQLLEDGKAQTLTQFLVVGGAGTSRPSWPTVHRDVDFTVE